MIVQIRLDDRLVHGQVATMWCRVLGVDAIVVANDAANNNPILKKTLVVGAPVGKKVVVRGVKDAIELLKDPRAEAMKVLLIADNPKDCLALVNELGVKEVNVANFVKKKNAATKYELASFCFATPEDLQYFKELCDTGAHVYSQMIPTSIPEDIKSAVEKVLNNH